MRRALIRLLSWVWTLGRQNVTVGRGSFVYPWRVKLSPGCQLTIGEGSQVGCFIRCDRPASIRIGSRTFIGKSLLVTAVGIDIGDDVLISWGTTIVDHNSHSLRFHVRKSDVAGWQRGHKVWDDVRISPVIIKSKCWIGFSAVILPGITVGEGAVVAAASVVTKDVPPWALVAGNPAKVIRELDPALDPM